MMINQTVDIHVTPSPEKCFDYVAEDFFANHRRWDPAIAALTQTAPGPIGVGTTGREVRRFGTRQAVDFRVTEFDRPRRFAFTNTSGPFWLDRAYTFTPADGGTDIRFTFVMRPRTLPFRILGPLVKGTIVRQVEANIHRLEGLLDRAPVGAVR
jgi:hypothetical protein